MYFLTRNVVFFWWMKNRCTTATFIYSQTYFRTPYYNKQKCLSKFFGPLKLFDGEGRTKSILVHIKTFQTNQTLDPLKWPPAFIFYEAIWEYLECFLETKNILFSDSAKKIWTFAVVEHVKPLVQLASFKDMNEHVPLHLQAVWCV